MNKPVFDKSLTIESLSVEPADLGNMLDDTIAGGVAADALPSDAERDPTVADDQDLAQVAAPDLLHDEKDGRRSIETFVSQEERANEMRGSSGDNAQALHVLVPGEQHENASPASAMPPLGEGAPALADMAMNGSTAVTALSKSSESLGSDSTLDALKQSADPSLGEPAVTASSGAPAPSAVRWQSVVDNDGVNNSWDYHTVGNTDGLFQYRFLAGGGNDIVIGTQGSDELWGEAGDDVLTGWNGNDTFWGGEGLDTVDYSGDTDVFGIKMKWDNLAPTGTVVIEGYRFSGGADKDYVHFDPDSAVEKIVGSNVSTGRDFFNADTTNSARKNTVAWNWEGRAGQDGFVGGVYNDTIDGGADADVILGKDGNDTLYGSNGFNDNAIDTIWGGGGNDRLEGSFGDILIGDIGNDTLVGGWAFYDDFTYTADWQFPSFKYSLLRDYTVDLRLGTVTAPSFGETDTLINVSQVATGGGNDILYAADGFGAWLRGGAGSDKLYGGAASDTLLGGSGFDFFYGSLGFDSIDGGVDGGVVDYISLPDEGQGVTIDLASGITYKPGAYDLISNIDHAQGTNRGDELFGNAGGNHLLGAGGGDIIRGGAGNDTLEGGDNNDKLFGESDNDTLDGGNGNDTLDGGDGIDSLVGGANDDSLDGGLKDDSLFGGTGNDTLWGGAGADYMEGNAGNDEYWVDNEGDVVVEIAGEGNQDIIYSFINYDLGAEAGYVENLTAAGNADIALTGNAGNNILTGNSGKNIFEGGVGADTMKGGLGDDYYYIRDLDDTPQEFNAKAEGIDTAEIFVANFDGRKLANIENIIVHTELGASVDYAPQKPRIVDGSVVTTYENNEPNKVVLKVIADDTDTVGGPLTYEILTHSDLFSVDANGNVTLKSTIDFENPPAGFVTEGNRKFILVDVRAVETSGGKYASDPTTLKIYIDNVDEAPTAPIVKSTSTTPENAYVSTQLAQVEGSVDPEGGVISYTFAEEADANPFGLFSISADGKITLQANKFLDYEATGLGDDGDGKGRYYTVKVIATDGTWKSTVTPVKIYVSNVAEAPNAPTYDGQPTVTENTRPEGTIVQLNGSDPDGTIPTYKLAETSDANPGNRFVVSSDGKITLAPNVVLDYEADDLIPDTVNGGKYYVVKVVAYDGTFASDVTPIRIYVADDNDLPTGVQFKDAPEKIVVGMGPGTPIVRAEAIDQDMANRGSDFVHNKYMFSNGTLEFGKFVIDADTGQISLKEALTPADVHSFSLEVVTYDEGHQADAVTATYQFTVENAPFIWEGNDPESEVLDIDIASPFTNVVVLDGGLTGLYLKVSFNPDEGELDFSDIPPLYEGYEYDPLTGVLKLTGSMQDIIDALHHLKFNPKDRPDGEVGSSVLTHFHLALVDRTGTEIATNDAVAVDAHVANRAPTIAGGSADFTIDDNETVNLVTPFAGITIDDTNANDTITVTITAIGQSGGDFIDADGNAFFGTYTISGPLVDVLAAVRALKFNPLDLDGAARGTTDVTTFQIDVHDEAGASVSFTPDITVTSVVANRAPDSIGLYDESIKEDLGVNRLVSQLKAHDDNGDTIVEYRLDDSSDGRFVIKQEADGTWSVYLVGVIDFENAQYMENGVSWYEIKVSAYDGVDWSTSQTVKIFIEDVNPDNSAPVITVDPDGHTDWVVPDTDTVAPFKDLTFSDAEDGATVPPIHVKVLITFTGTKGGLILPTGITGVEILQNGSGVLEVKGAPEDVTNFIKHVAFNPANGTSQTTDFTVWLTDSQGAYTTTHVTVDATASGNPNDNEAPVIQVDPLHATTNTEDWDAPVNPFAWVTLQDGDSGSDTLTLTISFKNSDGRLNGSDWGGTRSDDTLNDRVTWTFTGTLAALQEILSQHLTFDATEHNEPSPDPITTEFTITLDDHHHAFPASNKEVTVVTTVTGPTGLDDIHYVTEVGQKFNENADPALGGFDMAIVQITDQYILDDNDGIEILIADGALQSGINVVGNNLGNTIVGGDFNDTLDGGSSGDDALQGGLGDDTYVISRQQGVTIEEVADANGGQDTIRLVGEAFKDAGYTLSEFLENLDASGSSGAMTLNGNAAGNIITGNADSNILKGLEGDDTLDGGAGAAADILDGGSGNDTYRIRHIGDAIQEGAGDLFDVAEVYLHEEYRLKSDAQVETLKAGDGFIEGVHLVGNAYSVNLFGSGAVNVSDTLDGGTGVDIAHVLMGGDGNDTYYIVNVNDEIEGERDLANPEDNGKLYGDQDIAYLYGGLYATKEELQAKIDHYMAIGIEQVQVIDGVPEAPDNAAPTNVRLSNNTFMTSVDENSKQETGVGFVVADDDTGSEGMTFEIYGNDAFGIHADTGEIYVLDPSKLDREQVASYVVHVRAKDAGGLYSAWRDITINLTDVNEAADSISFNDVKNIHVGDTNNASVVTALAHDPDINTETFQTNLYRFQNGQGPDGTISADGLFKIDKDTGQVSLADGVTLSEEDKGAHTLWVVAYDKDHADIISQAFSFDVVVQDATGNTPPTNVRLATGGTSITVDENTPDSALDYKIVADDDKAGLKYYVEDNAYVTVDETTGQIHLKDTFTLDYEANPTFTFNVYAKDTVGAVSDTQTITVTLTDKNDGPESVSVADGTAIKVGDGSSIVVANASLVDRDTKEEFRHNHFQFVADDGWSGTTTRDGLFTINDDGQITTARDVLETDVFSHNLKVQAYDEDGNAVETTYTVNVGNGGNTAPTNIRFSELFIRENPSPNSLLGTLLADDTDSVTFTLKAGADLGGAIEIINGHEVYVKDYTKIDYEQTTNGELSFTVLADDGVNAPVEQLITVNVENLLTEGVSGTIGNDLIRGGIGSDNLKGDEGNDTISGGGGKDVLTGGGGADAFVFDSILSATTNFDRIQDFRVAEGDKIWLSQSVFKQAIGALGTLNEDAFVEGTVAQDAEDRIIYDSTSGKLYYDPNGTAGSTAPILFAQFRVDATHLAPVLTYQDFLVVI